MSDNATVWLTPNDVAAMLRVAPKTLRAWRYRRHGPPATPISRNAVRYDAAALDAWIAEQQGVSV